MICYCFVGKLTTAGHVCLDQSVTQSSLTHSKMIYQWPAALIKKVDDCIRNFIWTGNIQKYGACKVEWNKVCVPKAEGGLVICSLRTMNQTFLHRLTWNILYDTKD